jgi:hypothetical protein
MLGFTLFTIGFLVAMFGIQKFLEVDKIKKNWEKYRCRPDVMLMADFYGHDSTENLNYCLKSMFDIQSAGVTGPFYTYLAQFTSILSVFLNSINSIRMTFATIIGTITQVFQEFANRIKALMYRVQYTAIRIRFLMSRVFAIMFSVMFMGMSGIKAAQNFSNTFLFKFMDTFCFDPDTPIRIWRRNGELVAVPIREVVIGDVLEEGGRVTSTFQFAADGQEMVVLPGGILVSTNHYVRHESDWIQARDHPLAQSAPDWSGGIERPLICLNTTTNTFRIGDFLFRDYDETSAGDREAMDAVLRALNGCRADSGPGKAAETRGQLCSQMACGPEVHLRLANGDLLPASEVVLGIALSHGIVVGVVEKEVDTVVEIKGERFAAGTSLWDPETRCWRRGQSWMAASLLQMPQTFYSFVITPSATLETASGTMFRDYVEIHDPAFEESYASALKGQSEAHTTAEC